MEIKIPVNMPHSAIEGPGYEQEYLVVSAAGAYSASTTAGCNTRRYHGLLVAPQPQIDDAPHVLLSSLEETVFTGQASWALNTHRYPGVYYPNGYSYIKNFRAMPFPHWTFVNGKTVIQKSLTLTDDNILLLKYEFAGTDEEVKLHLAPLLAFRNAHHLRKAGDQFNAAIVPIRDGVSIKPFEHYSPLYFHFSEPAEVRHDVNWYYQVEYPEEARRGYDNHEDLFCPGSFDLVLRRNEPLVVAIGCQEYQHMACKKLFAQASGQHPASHSFAEHLQHAASQFLLHEGNSPYIKAGYYWFGQWGRDTCISLPGLTLLRGDLTSFKAIIDTLLADLKNGLIPNTGHGKTASYNSADASLWLIWSLQQYARLYGAEEDVWETYGTALSDILHYYKCGTDFGIGMADDGLLQAGQQGFAVTWMDAVTDGIAVTPRIGKAVELNALWYNAICFCLQAAKACGDDNFTSIWQHYPEKICYSFARAFWDTNKHYLADCVTGDERDWSVRPNQLLAVSLPYSPLPEEIGKAVFDKVRDELFTPRGLRTLSPRDSRYCGHYGGDQQTRDRAYHQGTAWPWLLAHYAEAYLRHYQEKALPILKNIYSGMEQAMQERCLYNLPEVCDGNFPHAPGGAVAQAWSVAELIRMKHIIDEAATTFAAGGKIPVTALPSPVPYLLYPTH